MSKNKFVVDPRPPDMWLIEALESRLANRNDDPLQIGRGLALHLVRALREARGIEIDDKWMRQVGESEPSLSDSSENQHFRNVFSNAVSTEEVE